MTRKILLVALVLATPALGQGYGRSDIVRGLCQPDGCDEFSVVEAAEMAATADGTLMQTRLKTFHASHAGRKDLGEETGYVYCSPTRPAVLADQDGRTMAFLLAPFASAESRESIRRNANYHAVYFAVCHGADFGKAAVQNIAGVAQNLGYRVSLAQSKTVTLNRAEDIVGSADRGAREARRDEPLPGPRDPAAREATRQAHGRSGELRMSGLTPGAPPPEDDGLLAVPRHMTNQAFDALDQIGNWILGR